MIRELSLEVSMNCVFSRLHWVLKVSGVIGGFTFCCRIKGKILSTRPGCTKGGTCKGSFSGNNFFEENSSLPESSQSRSTVFCNSQ